MIDLGTLPSGPFTARSQAFAINNRGQVVGNSRAADGRGHAVLWDHGAMFDLDALPGGSSSGPGGSDALDINRRGEVVGLSARVGESGDVNAALWQDGTMTALGTLPDGVSSVANAINNRGQIVGVRHIPSDGPPFFRAMLWQGNDVIDLGMLRGDVQSQAFDINNRGDIVGSSTNQSLQVTAVVWRKRQSQ